MFANVTRPSLRTVLLAAAASTLAACASSRPQAPPAPVPQTTPATASAASPLQPPAAAVRTAAHLQPTGLELGTMWTFENPPLDYWAKTYDFHPTQQWLDHVRLSSLRYADYCSASFVSPDGLVMTNHHCGRECVEAQSTPDHDYVTTGFYAATRAEEKVCPNLYVDQLVSIEDVTHQVQSAAPAGASDSATAAAIDAASQHIQQQCATETKLHCQVVSLYHGGMYHLYRYKRYAPVKLVFAPELQTGYFGGDLDNFTYPRYDLDVTFVRVYQPDGQTPLHPENYFKWREDGASVNEPVFVTGNPGSTSRLITVAQLMYERVFRHPFLLAYLHAQYDMLQAQVKQNPQAAQQVRQQMFEISNSIKDYEGEERGLLDTLIVARKIAWQRQFQDRIAANPQANAEYGDVFTKLAAIAQRKIEVAPSLNANNILMFPDPLQLAGVVVRIARQEALPEAQRQDQFKGSALQQLKTRIEQVPMDSARAASMLALRLQVLTTILPPTDSLLARLVHPGETPGQAAARLVASARILDPGVRTALIDGGVAAVDTSTAPLIEVTRSMETRYAELQPRWSRIQADEQVQQARLARALFAVYGTSVPPDATFTLRISGGRIEGYDYNGTEAPPYTSIYGLYGRSHDFQDKDPFTLAPTWVNRRADVNLATYLDQVSTNDITGGNSGSPLIDEQGRIVGLIFDSNIEALPSNFIFPIKNGRSVSVHTGGITEALRSVYQATALVKELTGQ